MNTQGEKFDIYDLDDVKPARKKNRSKEERQELVDRYAEIYDKTKNWKPNTTDKIKTFCSLPKSVFLECNLSLPELAVYPVLCTNADFQHDTKKQISLKIIAKKTGLSIPTVQKAINDLCNKVYPHPYIKDDQLKMIKLLDRERRTEGRRTFWTYNPYFVRKMELDKYGDNQIFFYTYLIEGGIWKDLDPRAKALYLAMRSTSVFDYKLYCELNNIEYNEKKKKAIYKDRKWEMCTLSINKLCKMIGISSSNTKFAIRQLLRKGLIAKNENSYFVYLYP